MKHVIIPIFISHRGCPNQCVFCNQRAITTRTGDVTVDDARKTIDTWLLSIDRASTEIEISFFGGSFTGIPMADQTAFLKLAKEYKDAGLVDKIHCSTRPDYIDRTILDNLKAWGMDVIELGVQSFDEKVLALSKRGHSADAVYEAADLIKEYGFTLGIQLMIGLPGDSYDSCMYSVRETIKIKPSIARLYPTVVIKDTELYEMQKDGRYVSPSQEEVLNTVKDMYLELEGSGIRVIRIGLKSNELIKGETYHPAFGQLVRSRIARDEIEKQLDALMALLPETDASCCHDRAAECARGQLTIEIAGPSDLINYASGHRQENRIYFEEKYPGLRLVFRKDDGLTDFVLKEIPKGR